METFLWILQITLALVFAAAGLVKVAKPREALAPKMRWVEGSTEAQIKAIGVAELMAAVGLVLPAALGVLPQLTALAAVGVVFLMLGAVKANRDYDELARVPVNVVIAVLAVFIVVERFGPHAL